MQDYQRQFLTFALHSGALRFGEFTLKSGRISPYFFNAGAFNCGSALAQLGRAYARTIVEAGVTFDLLFGPAYKGIPLAAVTAAALYEQHQLDIPYAFNRKEAKEHGEGGQLVGHPLSGRRVLLIDDVITAGTAIGEALALLAHHAATPAGVVIALDRQERGSGRISAIQEVEQQHAIPVFPIVRLHHLADYLHHHPDLAAYHARILAYRAEYGVEGG